MAATAAAADDVPIGAILPYAGGVAPPGNLPCDGREVSSDTYAALDNVVQNRFGFAVQHRHFKLPDLQGRTVIGVGSGVGLAPRSLGDVLGSESMPSHDHAFSVPGVDNELLDPDGPGNRHGRSLCGMSTYHGTTAPAGATGHGNMQPSLALTYIIKAE